MTGQKRRNRVVVLGVVFVLAMGVLWARLVQVQYLQRGHYRKLALEQRVYPREVPPVRGGIFDRNGRPLAINTSMYSVAIRPEGIESRHDAIRALTKSLGVSRAEVRRRLRSKDHYVYVRRQCMLTEEECTALSAVKGIEVEKTRGRVYPYGTVGYKVVGSVDVDNHGRSGAERAFEVDLHGEPGRERVVRNGRYASDRYYRYRERDPVDGRHVYLTLDVAVQEIAEAELRRVVAEHDADAGTVIVMEVQTGDVLALAEYPALDSRAGAWVDSLWTVRSLSHVYEPGSTFKLVTAASLLEAHEVSLTDTFDAENGRADLGHAVIRDPHPHGVLTFAEAFMYSSNIVMAKAIAALEPDEFYRAIRMFGFGARTGVRMHGESSGSVPVPDKWSGRTQMTLAFGQEVAVTPLQMVTAMAAIANDGTMMMPRFTRGVADASGKVRRYEPVKVRRVVSRRTARTMRELCRLVVTEGTGQKARVDFMAVAGKTGTGQKASPGGGYLPGRYMSSFAGFAPYEEPRIAVLVTLDSPRWASRYGGDSAAPAFARICRGIANATDILDGVLGAEPIEAPPLARAEDLAPNFMRMERAQALEYARRHGANVLCDGESGRVVAQVPDPGTPVAANDVIRLTVSPEPAAKAATPDLRGMSIRAARRLAAASGLGTRIVGTGTVRSQRPRPGAPAGSGVVKLYCEGAGSAGGGSQR